MFTLNVNGLHSPIKIHRVVEWIKEKKNPTICCTQETTCTFQDIHRLKVKGWKTIFHANGKQKRKEVAIFLYQTK